jgi:hypothetical protein
LNAHGHGGQRNDRVKWHLAMGGAKIEPCRDCRSEDEQCCLHEQYGSDPPADVDLQVNGDPASKSGTGHESGECRSGSRS